MHFAYSSCMQTLRNKHYHIAATNQNLDDNWIVEHQRSGYKIIGYGSGSSNRKSGISDPDPNTGFVSLYVLDVIKKVSNFG